MRRARSRLCVAMSAARPVRRTRSSSTRHHLVGGVRDRDCRWARRPAARRGLLASARTMATRCCSPPESRAGRWSARGASPTCSSSSSARARAAVSRDAGDHLRQHDVLQRREFRQQMVELIDEADRSRGGCAVRSRVGHACRNRGRPSSTSPPSGRSSSPATWSSVDLPAPDGPTSATISPGLSASDAPRSTGSGAPAWLEGAHRPGAARAPAPLALTHSAAPRPDRAAPRATTDRASPGRTGRTPSPPPPRPRRDRLRAGIWVRK